MTKKSFSSAETNSQLHELIHFDLCELNGILTRGEKKIFCYLHWWLSYSHVYLTTTKDEAFQKFKKFKSVVENQKDQKIKMSNRGGEYFSNEFDEFCEVHVIIHKKCSPYPPQQNDLAKRKNRTLVYLTNVLLLNAQ